MYSMKIISKIRNINSRRVFHNRVAGYMASHNKHRGRISLLCALALLLSVALLNACMDDANNNGSDSNGGNNNGSDSNNDNDGNNNTPPLSTAVTNITLTAITPTALTLNWTNPADSDGFTGVLISAEPAAGSLGMSQQQAASATTIEITDLNPITTYSFTLTSIYADDSKNSTSPPHTDMTTSRATLPIDADGDRLVDITSLERLNNIRHNLDLGAAEDSTAGTLADDGRYKTSADIAENSGMLCGTEQNIPCIGYELVISLDFTNPHHYESGMVNAAWRPNSMANNMGNILPQTMADDGQNSGWQPIGTSDNSFNGRFDGNGHTISNLYGRLPNSGSLGLFGATSANSVIRSVGVATVRLYGSDEEDTIGALAGNGSGTIIASYASGSVSGGASADHVGGLVGEASGNSIIIASYASGSVNGGANTALGTDNVGVLVGRAIGSSTTDNIIIASYASGTADGGANSDTVGVLVGISDNNTIIASYASGTANGGAGNDNVGGLGGGFRGSFAIIASYATATADGDADSNAVGSIGFAGSNDRFVATYGFGVASNFNTAGSNGTTDRPAGVAAGSGIEGASMLTLATAGAAWNQVNTDAMPLIATLDAWDFGDSSQTPALRYADYDGSDKNTYGCGDDDDSTATIVIPSVVAAPTGPMTIACGITRLPGQQR